MKEGKQCMFDKDERKNSAEDLFDEKQIDEKLLEMLFDEKMHNRTARMICLWGLAFAVISLVLWSLYSSKPVWYSIVASVVTFFMYTGFAWATVDSLKRTDFTDSKKYWDTTKRMLNGFAGTISMTAFIVSMSILVAMR